MLGRLGVAQARHRQVAALPIRLRRAQPPPPLLPRVPAHRRRPVMPGRHTMWPSLQRRRQLSCHLLTDPQPCATMGISFRNETEVAERSQRFIGGAGVSGGDMPFVVFLAWAGWVSQRRSLNPFRHG